MERLPCKLAIVTHIVPPATVGSAMRYYRLLKDTDPDDYCLLISRDYHGMHEPHKLDGSLSGKHYRLLPEQVLSAPRSTPWLGPAVHFTNHVLRVLKRARNISGFVKREKCQAIMGLSGDLHDLPAGYIASLWCRIPFYAAVDDYYSYQWTDPLDRLFARLVEPILLKGSSGILVINEFLRDDYKRRYHITPLLVRNPYESISAAGDFDEPRYKGDGETGIVFTGSIYHANHDAFQNLAEAMRVLNSSGLRLHVFTSQPFEELKLEENGIWGPIVLHRGVSPNESLQVQSRADILFLPLGFDTGIPEVIRTSAPFKMAEYMSSGTPILVYAPPDTYLSWYFRKYECGLVVNSNKPEEITEAIKRLLTDPNLRYRLTTSALTRARADFSIELSQVTFRKLFKTCKK